MHVLRPVTLLPCFQIRYACHVLRKHYWTSDQTFWSCLVNKIWCTKCDVRRIVNSNCSLTIQVEQVLVLVLVKPFIVIFKSQIALTLLGLPCMFLVYEGFRICQNWLEQWFIIRSLKLFFLLWFLSYDGNYQEKVNSWQLS